MKCSALAASELVSLYLTHAIPGDRAGELGQLVSKSFKGKLTVGADLMRFHPRQRRGIDSAMS